MTSELNFEQVMSLAKNRSNPSMYYAIHRFAHCFTGDGKQDILNANHIVDSIQNNNTAHTVAAAFRWCYEKFYGVEFNAKLIHRRSAEISKFTTRLDKRQIDHLYRKGSEYCLCNDIYHKPIKQLTIIRRSKVYHYFNILLHTAMRSGELASINFASQIINRTVKSYFSDKQVYEVIINTEKTHKKREVYIPIESFEFLKKHGGVKQSTAKSAFNDFSTGAKLDFKFTAHVCRRTFATLLHESGVDIPTIAMILGNTPQVVMNHYILSSQRNFDACDMVYGVLGGILNKTNNLYLTSNGSINSKTLTNT